VRLELLSSALGGFDLSEYDLDGPLPMCRTIWLSWTARPRSEMLQTERANNFRFVVLKPLIS